MVSVFFRRITLGYLPEKLSDCELYLKQGLKQQKNQTSITKLKHMKTKTGYNLIAISLISFLLLMIQACEKEKKNNQLPSCKITAPADGQEITKGETITISVEAVDSDGNIKEVCFYVDDAEKGCVNGTPYTYNWNTNSEASGSHTLKAVSVDNDNGESSDEITVAIVEDSNHSLPCPGVPTVNYEGREYNTVLIGDQCWLKENLNVGTMINGEEVQQNNGIVEKYCYDNDPANCEIYGGLYQWDEMMQYNTAQSIQGVCPAGWHLPSDNEWKTMEMFLGMTQSQADNVAWRGTDEGSKLKETGTNHWAAPNSSATNSSGFTALPGGGHSGAFFEFITDRAIFLTSTEYYPGTMSYFRQLMSGVDMIYRGSLALDESTSVRCIKD